MIKFKADGVANTGSPVNVGTHHGTFHADEVFATAILLQAYGDLHVTRTRDPVVLDQQDALLDVGGVYDEATRRYDHHQKGGAGGRADGMPYATAGLVWRSFGERVVRAFDSGLSDSEVAEIYARIDAEFFHFIDAVDCGVDVPGPASVSISSIISGFKPGWYEAPDFDAGFEKAVWFALEIVRNCIRDNMGAVKARVVVESATQVNEGKVLVFDRFAPWTETVRKDMPDVLYVVYPGATGDWRVQVVPAEPGSFKARKSLPESWAGLNDAKLSEAVGIPGCVFCHNGRFICANQTKAGALEMARKAVAHD
jgi:uncharacterized UPF0160 family protein